MKKVILFLTSLLLSHLLTAQNPYFLAFSLNADSVRLALTANPDVESLIFLPGKIIALDQHQAKIEYSFHKDKLYRIQLTRRYPARQSNEVFRSVFGYFEAMRFQSVMREKQALKDGTCFYRNGQDLVGILRQTETHSDMEISLELHKLANSPVYAWQKEDYFVGVTAMPVAALLRSQSPVAHATRSYGYPGISNSLVLYARNPANNPGLSMLSK